jgi:hypothetical protein
MAVKNRVSVGEQLVSLHSKKGKFLQDGERSNEEKSVQVVRADREPPLLLYTAVT